jgi:enamine deaminase RidA (YjgF/YER057c/UK114 family)
MRGSKVVIALLVLLCAGLALGVDKKIISPPGTKPGGNYSQGILIGGTLYISGQGGEDAAAKIPGHFDAEVRQSLDNIGDTGKFQRMSAITQVVSVICDPPERQ